MSETPRQTSSPSETLWRTVSFALRNRWLALVGAILTATILVAAAFARGRTYTVRTSFTPAGQQNGLLAYAGVAAQLGVQLPAQGRQPPEFYVYMLKSDAILRGLAGRRFATHAGSQDGVPLATLLNATQADSALRELAVLEEMKRIVRVRYDVRSQLVQLDVMTRWPGLSYQLSAALLEQVDGFNRDVLRTQAGEERRFGESRVREIGGDLKAAEDSLTAFLVRNREIQTSPVLRVQASRLEREVQTQQSLYLSVRQAYEQSRLEEVRNTPVISVIEAPVYPASPDRRRLIARGVLGLLLGTALGLTIGLGRNVLERAVSEHPALAESTGGQLAAFGHELRSPKRVWRELRREVGRDVGPTG